MTQEGVQAMEVPMKDMAVHEVLPESTSTLEVDAGNLLVVDPAPIDKKLLQDKEGACKEIATKMVQHLVQSLFALPGESIPMGRFVNLPKPTTLCPRHKRLPDKNKPLTRWEQFAKDKGIVKRKREKYVYDENMDEFRRRYGYNRVNDINDVAVIAAKASDKVGEDPFSKHGKDKKEKVRRQEERRFTNLKAVAKQGGKHALPATITMTRNLDSAQSLLPTERAYKQKLPKSELLKGALSAAEATASMGKFDRKSKLDSSMSKKKRKRHQYAPVVGKGSGVSEGEKASMADTVRRILKENDEPILNVNRAIKEVKPRMTPRKGNFKKKSKFQK